MMFSNAKFVPAKCSGFLKQEQQWCQITFVICLSLHIDSFFFSAWFSRHLIYIYCSTSYFGTFGRGRACPRTFFLSTLIAAPQRPKLEFIFRCPERAQALGTGRPAMSRYHGEDL